MRLQSYAFIFYYPNFLATFFNSNSISLIYSYKYNLFQPKNILDKYFS